MGIGDKVEFLTHCKAKFKKFNYIGMNSYQMVYPHF